MLTAECPARLRASLCESLLWPLNVFYLRYGRRPPVLTPLMPGHMPQPYRELLVHRNDMTPTLETYHSGTIFIERLHTMDGDNESSREVILRIEGTGKPVEYGASRVFLDKLTPDARELFFEGRTPLGTILRLCGNHHTHSPSGFFRVEPAPVFSETFGVECQESLYGRRNTLLADDGEPLAEVCEIMPPRALVTKGE